MAKITLRGPITKDMVREPSVVFNPLLLKDFIAQQKKDEDIKGGDFAMVLKRFSVLEDGRVLDVEPMEDAKPPLVFTPGKGWEAFRDYEALLESMPISDEEADRLTSLMTIDAATLQEMRKCGGKWAAYQNQDRGHPSPGHVWFIKFGDGCTFKEPPKVYPDTADEIMSSCKLVGIADLENGTIKEVIK